MEERKRIRPTKYSAESGWASRFAPGYLERASEGLTSQALGGFAGGMETRDDARYGPIGGGPLLQAANFIAPVVDVPYRFGPIAGSVVGVRVKA